MDHILFDLRSAFRSIARYPVAATVAIVSLAGGIGAATATLTFRDAIFRNPPPLYAAPADLSMVTTATPTTTRSRVPAGLYNTWLQDNALARRIAASAHEVQRDVRFADRVEPLTIRSVTTELFSILGVAPAFGRSFDSVPPDGPAPVVLSHRIWREWFEGRPEALGQTIWIDNAPHVVVGVMPERFWFVSTFPSMWTRLETETLPPTAMLDVVVRRAGGVTAAAVEQQLQTSANNYVTQLPAGRQQLRVLLGPVGGTPLGNAIGPVPLVLMGMSVFLTLLIACTNVAILMIAQWTAREHEIAIRASLGASRGRIVRSLVTESVVLAMGGGLLGLCLTFALRGIIVRNVRAVTFFDISIHPMVFVQSAIIILLVGLLTGLAPAIYETRRSQVNPLRQLRSSDRVRQRWRHALVGFEIAVTVALMVVTGALVSAYRKTLSDDPGFDTRPLLSMRIDNPEGVAIESVLGRLRAIPGVASAAASSSVPIAARGAAQDVATDQAGSHLRSAERVEIAKNLFPTLGARLRAGRVFVDDEHATAARVAIVNDLLASQLWPGRQAIGAQLWTNGSAYQVVGVVEAYSSAPLQPPRGAFYVPLNTQAVSPQRVYFLVRAHGDPAALLQPIRREVLALPSSDGVSQLATLDQILDIGSQEILMTAYPMVPLIAIGILLTAAGIYGVLAFAVARRANELAIRIAIGAQRRDLVRLITLHSVRLLASGLVGGIAFTFALTRLAQGRGGVFDSPGWQAFAFPIVIVMAVGLLATWIPSRRASRIDPALLLRST